MMLDGGSIICQIKNFVFYRLGEVEAAIHQKEEHINWLEGEKGHLNNKISELYQEAKNKQER